MISNWSPANLYAKPILNYSCNKLEYTVLFWQKKKKRFFFLFFFCLKKKKKTILGAKPSPASQCSLWAPVTWAGYVHCLPYCTIRRRNYHFRLTCTWAQEYYVFPQLWCKFTYANLPILYVAGIICFEIKGIMKVILKFGLLDLFLSAFAFCTW